ncbi:MAG TPA: SigB/SigF/SigG family RNA polymerase sigma factor [Acidimicrobiales bacterium]|nr:SigB/SigF/SigG family RNA polymerase sigma factor [Acidimicrobiales bacterium]
MTESVPSSDELFAAYAASGDLDTRNLLVERYAGLAEALARRFANRGVPLDDLVQVAQLGLLKAVERYSTEHGAAFTTFATPTVLGEIKRHFRDKTWSIRVPRSIKDLHLRVGPAVAELHHLLGRSPTVAEIADHIGVDEDAVLEAMEAGAAYRPDSVDAPGGSGEGPTIADTLRDGASPELAEVRVTVRALMRQLPERERTVVYLRYFEDLTQAEIAERVGVSQVHVSRLLRKALQSLGDLV